MALQYCKECGEEISSEAKQCPKCGYDNRSWWGKRSTLSKIAIIFFGLMILVGMFGEDSETVVVQPTEKVNQPSDTVTPTVSQLQIQEQPKPKIRSATLSVDRVVESVANLGKIRITVTNTGDVSINPNFDVTVTDSEGKVVCEDSPMFGIGSIAAGERKTDEIQILSCIFDKDGDYTVKVDLLDKDFNKLDTDSKILTVNYWNLLGGEAP